jgi:hypothetical protein
MTDRFESARAILHEQIVQRQTELDSLFAAYEKLGGTYEDETAAVEEEPEVKRLTGPKPKRAKKKSKRKAAPPPVANGAAAVFTINGKSIEMSERHHNILELIQGGGGAPVSKADLAGCFGKAMPNWDATMKAINNRLAAAMVAVVNVRGAGWKLEKLA